MDIALLHLMILCLFAFIAIEDIRRGVIHDGALVLGLSLTISLAVVEGWVWQEIAQSFTLLPGLMLLLYLFPRARESRLIGFGDVKLAGLIAFYVAPSSIPLFLLLTGFFGLLTPVVMNSGSPAYIRIFTARVTPEKDVSYIPFAPALILGMGGVMLWQWYEIAG